MKINNTFLNVIKIAISGLIVVNFILNIIILKSNNNQDYDRQSNEQNYVFWQFPIFHTNFPIISYIKYTSLAAKDIVKLL